MFKLLHLSQQSDTVATVCKFVQVRVKSIQFYEQEAVAIYFYDVTHHI